MSKVKIIFLGLAIMVLAIIGIVAYLIQNPGPESPSYTSGESQNEKTTETISASCPEACKKYSDCAGYTEGATAADQQDAYESCLEECSGWSEEAIICVNKQPINNPGDCVSFTICVLGEYDSFLE